MRRSIWTPSIVPDGDDHNVYLVVDDFGRNGWAYRETDVENADLENSDHDGQYKNPIRVLASTRRRADLRTYQATLQMNCAGAPISNCAISRQAFRISSSATPGTLTGN